MADSKDYVEEHRYFFEVQTKKRIDAVSDFCRPKDRYVLLNKYYFEVQSVKLLEAMGQIMKKAVLNAGDIKAVRMILEVYEAMTPIAITELEKFYKQHLTIALPIRSNLHHEVNAVFITEIFYVVTTQMFSFGTRIPIVAVRVFKKP